MTVVEPKGVRWWEDRLEVGREVTLLGLSIAALVSLGRLFVGNDHVAPLLVTAVVAHLFLMGLRRTGRSLALVACLLPFAALVTTVVLFEPRSTVLGLPTPSSFDRLAGDLDTALALFGETPTPTVPVTGFLILCAAALWISAFVSDWACFRLDLPVEAMLPSGTIFVFSAVLADDHQRTPATLVAVVAALAFFLVHRVARQTRTGQWVAGSSGRGSAALIGTGTIMLLIAVLAASISGPSLPGAGAAPLVELEPNTNAPQSRVTVSPLVDIRRRLVDQANVEVFTVESDVRAYWRLTALDSFDGRIWSSSGSYGRASGGLEGSGESPSTFAPVSQTFEVKALAAIWLPAAFEPREVEADLDLRYDEFSSTLIVDTDILDSDGVSYTVRSDLPTFDADTLRDTTGVYPEDITEAHLQLPDDFPSSVAQLAVEQTSGVVADPTPYESALLLQDFLRGFRYDLSVPGGHTGDDLERFLLVDRAGYCEQFAGAFAAMARSLGIPARVAVGFTPGIEVEPGLFSVRGEHAHAWPEVYFAGLGWVPFEPTPGRGAPGAETYTGVPEQQVQSGGNPNTATTLPSATTQPETQTTQPPDDLNVEAATPDNAPAADAAATADAGSDSNGLWRWFVWTAIALGGMLLVAAAYVLVALGLDHHRRTRRRAAAESAADRVQLAWDESLAQLGLIGLVDVPSETHAETAGRASQILPTGAEHARTIGVLAEAAVYGPSGIGDAEAETAEQAAGEIGQIVHAVTSVTTRSRRLLRPAVMLGVGPIRRIGGDRSDVSSDRGSDVEV